MPRVLVQASGEFSGLYCAETIEKPALFGDVSTPFRNSCGEDEAKEVIGRSLED